MVPFNREEIIEIASSLEDYHRVFYTFFQMSNIFYYEDIPTAAIRFHKNQNPDLLINSDFWVGLNHRERLFVICHECLHVLLKHDTRNGMEIKGATHKIVNVAQDICINEMIVSMFGFDREDIRDWKKYCWVDTCFKETGKVKLSTVRYNETFDYYLKLLIEDDQQENLPDTVDEHEQGDGQGPTHGDLDDNPFDNGIQDKINEITGKLAEDLTQEEIEKIIAQDPDSSLAGIAEGIMGMWLKRNTKQKIRFSRIIRGLKRSRIKESEVDGESFSKQDRRFDDIIRRSKVSLPGKHPRQKPLKDRLLTVGFMDISGSCVQYVPIFNEVLAAFDREKHIFELETFTFDITTKPFIMGQKVTGGGGTRFGILEQRVQELKAKYGKYPDCVIVISDGDGQFFTPEIPKRWIWLLTPDNPVYRFIPEGSRKYLLSDVIL